MQETNIVRKIMLAIGINPNIRIFRNNTGSAWIGASTRFTKRQSVNVEAGDVLIKNARFFNAGLCVGSSDLIGIKSTEITPDMVGQKIAIFTAIEVKQPNGRTSKEQINFINMVNSLGGIAFIAHSDDEAKSFLKL
jgi:hypothetical protein